MRINIGGDDAKSSTFSSRPVSSTISINPAEKRIEDITNLSLGQDPVSESGPNSLRASTTLNPLKRAAAPESASAEHANHPGDPSGPSRSRRAKALSGEAVLPKDFDYDRKASMSRLPGSTNERTASKTLFNPNADRASGSSPRRSGYGDISAASRLAQPSKLAVVPTRGELNETKNQNRQNQPGILEKSSFNIVDPVPDEGNLPSESVDEPNQELGEEQDPEILFQPETRPISHEQLVTEVKGIYAGLVMVEAKCIDVDEKQSKAAQERDPSKQIRLTAEQWQALIALHKTLLHEHHDFFLASQHPSASPALSKLAAKYSMPARMWRHGIHAFLEVLRHRLPDSLDHMLAFIYIAYSMMALLYETVPAFEDTWIECLGDLGRYRMAIEDDDIRDREVWSGVARFWYGKAADKRPNTGRLYHHLAILARPYTLQQLSLYTRSLTCIIPFESARGSIMTLFHPILNGWQSSHQKPSQMETVFVKAHGLLFVQASQEPQKSQASLEGYVACVEELRVSLIESYIERTGARFKEQGVFAAISNISALLEYGVLDEQGSSRSILRVAIEKNRFGKVITETARNTTSIGTASSSPAVTKSLLDDMDFIQYRVSQRTTLHASDIAFWTLSVVLEHLGDRNAFPLVHVYLVFLCSVMGIEKAMEVIEKDVPWSELAEFLNTIAKPETMTRKVRSEKFPKPSDGIGRPLPEDFVMRGQLWSEDYFPDTWFSDAAIDDEERALELPSMAAPRLERILWLGHRIAAVNRWLTYNHEAKAFAVSPVAAGFPARKIKQPIPLPTDGVTVPAPIATRDPRFPHVENDPAKSTQSSTKPLAFELQNSSSELRPPSSTSKKGYKVAFKPGKDPPSRQPTKILTREDVEMPDAQPIKREERSSIPVKAENIYSMEWLKGEDQTKAIGPVKIDPDELVSDPVKLEHIMVVDSTDNKA